VTIVLKKTNTLPNPKGNPAGRPQKTFMESSQKTKIRKVDSLVKNYSTEELCFAAERSKLIYNSQSSEQNLVEKRV